MINYSVIVPVFNSEEILGELVLRVHGVFEKNNSSFEIILVDDGSQDESWKKIEELKIQYPKTLKAIKLTKNFGQHNATLCGIGLSIGNQIITIDDDLQFPPEEINKLIQCFEKTNADLVYGVPENKKHSAIRNAGTYYVKATSNQSKGGSSFRLLKRTICDEIIEKHQNNFLFLDTIVTWYTNNIETVLVEHLPRKSGKSGYSLSKLISLYFNIIINYSAVPLKLMTYGGLFFSIITFLFGIRFIYKKLVHHVPIGYTSIIVTVLFSTSLILLCLGIIGQYLYKLYQMQNKKPPYSIQKLIK
ncbi:MAG: glycosyltransferase family 2 protein [Bacteroidetes bacterium]|nr:glycosyltransferase family 2 protein [Bacteroidota bacterium]